MTTIAATRFKKLHDGDGEPLTEELVSVAKKELRYWHARVSWIKRVWTAPDDNEQGYVFTLQGVHPAIKHQVNRFAILIYKDSDDSRYHSVWQWED